ncbi:MAG: TIGR03668 family PPOX class F420-dependent oxidoreductase [Chloroflexi bacterium]|nr:MAG: TIGR03668 family PPOX class F420-dependent oxidoreductase [Chloroflexota bacterium]
MLSSEELRFTESQRVAHLATADASGRPHVVPVCFAYLDGRIYIAIDEKPKRSLRLKRLRNIEENPEVAIVLDRYDEDWSRLALVLVHGMATVLDRGTEHGRAIARLREKYPQYRTMALEDRPVIRVTVERVSNWGELS